LKLLSIVTFAAGVAVSAAMVMLSGVIIKKNTATKLGRTLDMVISSLCFIALSRILESTSVPDIIENCSGQSECQSQPVDTSMIMRVEGDEELVNYEFRKN